MKQENNLLIDWSSVEGGFIMLPNAISQLAKVKGKTFSLQVKVLYAFLAKYQHDKGGDSVSVAESFLGNKFGVNKKTISKWLSNLEELGLVEIIQPEKRGLQKSYSILDIPLDDVSKPSQTPYQNDNFNMPYVHENVSLLKKRKATLNDDKYKALKKLVDAKSKLKEVFSSNDYADFLKAWENDNKQPAKQSELVVGDITLIPKEDDKSLQDLQQEAMRLTRLINPEFKEGYKKKLFSLIEDEKLNDPSKDGGGILVNAMNDNLVFMDYEYDPSFVGAVVAVNHEIGKVVNSKFFYEKAISVLNDNDNKENSKSVTFIDDTNPIKFDEEFIPF